MINGGNDEEDDNNGNDNDDDDAVVWKFDEIRSDQIRLDYVDGSTQITHLLTYLLTWMYCTLLYVYTYSISIIHTS